MLSKEHLLYEWGCLEVLRVEWNGRDQRNHGDDLGLIYVPEPMRVDVPEGAKDLRCAGKITVVLQQSSPTVVGWTQLELVTVGNSLLFKPIVFNFRFSRSASASKYRPVQR